MSTEATWRVMALTEADIPSAIALWESCEGVGLGQADSPQRVRRFLQANPDLSLAVRDQAGKLLAAVLVGSDSRRGYLYHLAVRRGSRRRGIGQALAGRAIAQLARAGVDRCNICVFADNAAAWSFWESASFAQRDNLVLMSRPTAT
jgi:N-acetylglutamate synthase